MADDCCARFASFHDRPHRYEAEERTLDLDAVSHTHDGSGKVTVTARSLLLTRDVRVQTSQETIYDARAAGLRIPPWHMDTYAGGLGLWPAVLERWEQHGARVLDLAAGLAMFATEARVLGIEVDCADLEFIDDHPMFGPAKKAVVTSYPEQLQFLRCLSLHSDNATYAMDDATSSLLERLYVSRHEIAESYPQPSGRRFRADATDLAGIDTDTYDAVVCPWLLVHLDEEAERAVIGEAVRVTRPGGQVRLRAGIGGDMAERVRWRLGMRATDDVGIVDAKAVAIADESHDDLAVLDVVAT